MSPPVVGLYTGNAPAQTLTQTPSAIAAAAHTAPSTKPPTVEGAKPCARGNQSSAGTPSRHLGQNAQVATQWPGSRNTVEAVVWAPGNSWGSEGVRIMVRHLPGAPAGRLGPVGQKRPPLTHRSLQRNSGCRKGHCLCAAGLVQTCRSPKRCSPPPTTSAPFWTESPPFVTQGGHSAQLQVGGRTQYGGPASWR